MSTLLQNLIIMTLTDFIKEITTRIAVPSENDKKKLREQLIELSIERAKEREDYLQELDIDNQEEKTCHYTKNAPNASSPAASPNTSPCSLPNTLPCSSPNAHLHASSNGSSNGSPNGSPNGQKSRLSNGQTAHFSVMSNSKFSRLLIGQLIDEFTNAFPRHSLIKFSPSPSPTHTNWAFFNTPRPPDLLRSSHRYSHHLDDHQLANQVPA